MTPEQLIDNCLSHAVPYGEPVKLPDTVVKELRKCFPKKFKYDKAWVGYHCNRYRCYRTIFTWSESRQQYYPISKTNLLKGETNTARYRKRINRDIAAIRKHWNLPKDIHIDHVVPLVNLVKLWRSDKELRKKYGSFEKYHWHEVKLQMLYATDNIRKSATLVPATNETFTCEKILGAWCYRSK